MPKTALCHPEKPAYCRQLCRSCYNKLPHIQETQRIWRKTPKRKEWVKKYDKGAVRAKIYRKGRHGFTTDDEIRFNSIKNCDWCNHSFDENEKPYIDHDHRCCNSDKHCNNCTRGFVHRHCNSMAIAYFEWLESKFGETHELLASYRKKFPVPR